MYNVQGYSMYLTLRIPCPDTWCEKILPLQKHHIHSLGIITSKHTPHSRIYEKPTNLLLWLSSLKLQHFPLLSCTFIHCSRLLQPWRSSLLDCQRILCFSALSLLSYTKFHRTNICSYSLIEHLRYSKIIPRYTFCSASMINTEYILC